MIAWWLNISLFWTWTIHSLYEIFEDTQCILAFDHWLMLNIHGNIGFNLWQPDFDSIWVTYIESICLTSGWLIADYFWGKSNKKHQND